MPGSPGVLNGGVMMSGKEVYDLIVELAGSQGFYSRLLKHLNEVPEETRLQFLNSFADKDALDVIMALEG